MFFEHSGKGAFFGFDDELELAVYSSEINWRDDGEFEFRGLISSPPTKVSSPLQGVDGLEQELKEK